ncbi:MAG TPA: aspartate-semialdehyde dehydrogenase [Candidatus Thiothrix moscowensis]|uniref:aspartate-semialdehyde dehydrogenase n=1 Tax=unclassified Thiothrix TaxID=2636184 RepID=UPI0025EE1C88|nr:MULTISPECIES: aspartate-semialdehyde dehydrogenase [unclassified Thiothrix]HRJ51707.1 aspartate-semialdehyde dehydrogenase [Candidatus Thiothrix moscowensis]HRJ92022.1 aspartate-semialdehyde dehydrogenase [Candidatus Thiothrix moscowensis]
MNKVDVAVVGATTLVGEAMLDLLASRKFPAGRVYALEAETDGEQDVDFGNKTLDVEPLADFDFASVQLVLFAAGEDIAARYAPEAVVAGCVVIDDSACFRFDADVPLVVAEVNPQDIAAGKTRRIIANPGSTVSQILAVLKPLHDRVTVTRINAVTFQAVSGSGRAGVDELARQTAQLLNARPVEPSLYPRQIAFNLLPHIGAFQENGYTWEEMKMVLETRKILGEATLPVNPSAVRVPVFFGHAVALHVETAQKLSAAETVRLLTAAAGVTVLDERADSGYATPVTDAVNTDTVYVSRIREDISCAAGLDLWVVADNVRKSAALNAVQIAEILVRDYLPDWLSGN